MRLAVKPCGRWRRAERGCRRNSRYPFARNLHRLRPRGEFRLARRAVTDAAKTYAAAPLSLNDWALEDAGSMAGRAHVRFMREQIHFRFHARDLHLVLGSVSGRPVRFRVTLDGQVPRRDAGMDVSASGLGDGD